jgi:hypothetical protein
MANWYGSARSNYVRITDIDALKQDLAPLGGVRIVDKKDPETGETLYAFLGDDQDSGDFPSSYFDEEAEDSVEVDFAKMVMKFVPVGECLILMVCGAEKLRYITGFSTAYSWRKNPNGSRTLRVKQVSLEDIYYLVQRDWKIKPTQASY